MTRGLPGAYMPLLAGVALLALASAVALVSGFWSPAARGPRYPQAGCAAVAFQLHRIAGGETDEDLLATLPRSALGAALDARGSNVSHVVVDRSTATQSCPAGSDLVVRFAWAWSAGLDGWGVGAARIDGVGGEALERAFFERTDLASASAEQRTAAGHRYHIHDGRMPTYTSDDTLYYVTHFSDVDCLSPSSCSPLTPEGPTLWDAIVGQLP